MIIRKYTNKNFRIYLLLNNNNNIYIYMHSFLILMIKIFLTK